MLSGEAYIIDKKGCLTKGGANDETITLLGTSLKRGTKTREDKKLKTENSLWVGNYERTNLPYDILVGTVQR